MKTTLIGFHGFKRSGKTTIAGELGKMLIVQHHKQVMLFGFADALKDQVCAALGVSRLHLEENKERFRPLLQWWGVYRREFNGEDYWIEKLDKKITNVRMFIPGVVILVSDVRFENEYNYITDNGGKVFKIHPHNSPYEYDDAHVSEKPLDIAMPMIYNDFKDHKIVREQLQQTIKEQL